MRGDLIQYLAAESDFKKSAPTALYFIKKKTKKMAQNIFEKVQMTAPQRSMFDLSHDVKASFNFGYLYPVWTRMCMPGDRINSSQEALIRALPLIAPVMHRINVSIHTFFVPLRLLWDNWKNYATNTKVGGVLPAHPFVTIEQNGSSYNRLMDYFGLPTPGVAPFNQTNAKVNALPFSAYFFIYNEYYRDQNLQAEINYKALDGDNSSEQLAVTDLLRRSWKHDYFTSCLPFAQKGDAVSMPFNFQDVPVRRDDPTDPTGLTSWLTTLGTSPLSVANEPPVDPTSIVQNLYAKTSVLAGSSSINDLRTAEALQKWLERAARGGSRYTEWILSMYGVRSSDARLQRPEYVNGSVSPLLISDVANTSDTTTAPQGTLSGEATAHVNGRSSGYFCEEFGIMMSILSIMPETAYQQGIEKSLWLRINDPSELPNPLFAQLGEQEVTNKEVAAYGSAPDGLFGYLPRFAEDRFENSRVCGQMKTSLNFWHLGRTFATEPALNSTFIECDPSYRVFAVDDTDEDHFVAHIYNRISALRPLPKYNNPTLN